MKLLMFFVLVLPMLNAYGSSFLLVSNNPNKEEKTEGLLREVENELPVLMKQSFDEPFVLDSESEKSKGAIFHQVALAYDIENGNSYQPQFENITGWMNKGVLLKKRVNLNKFLDRSPDPLELQSREETFAINFKLFMTDLNYMCRRPSYYKYYSELFKIQPFKDHNCKINYGITLTSESLEANLTTSRNIDPSRIYQIHYLFAAKGEQVMSRWGHAMFRIILCAPGKEVGPSCMSDYAYHIVASYRANVEDVDISYRKGMNGSYTSQLFMMNMSEVVDEYTKGELRDIISIPLKLTREQIALFTNKLLENYWSYRGKYYFLTNNCATEALNLLRATFLDNNELQLKSVLTPLGLYDFLVSTNIADSSVLIDRNEAIRLGYIFQGVSDKMKESLSAVADSKDFDFEKFANDVTFIERREIYSKKLKNSNNKISILANALRLEEQVSLSKEQLFTKKVGAALFGRSPIPELKDSSINERIMEIRDLYKKLILENITVKGYGIPLEQEITTMSPESAKEILASIQGTTKDLSDIAIKFFPEEIEEMRGCMENRVWIINEMDSSFKK